MRFLIMIGRRKEITMRKIRFFAQLLCILLALPAGVASAQYGRLVPPPALLDQFDKSCGASQPDFAAKLPPMASRLHWDELGLSKAARPGDRGWLVAVGGQPVIVDISKPAPGQQLCSTSSVTNPGAILRLLTQRAGRKPDYARTKNDSLIQGWKPSARASGEIFITTSPGQAMARITLKTVP